MDSLFYESLHSGGYVLSDISSAHCLEKNPVCDNPPPERRLNLHSLCHEKMHHRISVPNQKTFKITDEDVRTSKNNSFFEILKPYVSGFVSKLTPTVSAKEGDSWNQLNFETELDEDQAIKDRLFGMGEQPAEMLADEIMRNESGWDRLKEMFSRQETRGRTVLSQDLANVIHVAFNASVIAFIFGYYGGHVKCREAFAEKHYHTKWQSRFHAARAYRDAVMIAGFKSGAKLGLRIGALMGMWVLVATSISVYRNKTGFIEHAAGGTAAGVLHGMELGLRGMFARGAIAGGLGLVMGSVMYFGFSATNETQEQRRYWEIVRRLQESSNDQGLIKD